MDELGLTLAPPASSSVVALLEREEHRPKILDRLHRRLCGAGLGLEQLPEAPRPLRPMNATVDHARSPTSRSLEVAATSVAAAVPATRSSRFSLMKSLPNARSASYWLWARHRSRMLSTVALPPRATGST